VGNTASGAAGAPEAQAAASAPPPPAEYLSRSVAGDLREIVVDEVWAYRHLAYQLTLRDVRIRYKQAVMGFAWAILMPALIVLAGVLVRYAMAYVGGSEVNAGEVAGMAVKALPWAFFVGAIGFATVSLTGNAQLVTKIYFPREVLPLSATLAQAFDTTVGLVALTVALTIMGAVTFPTAIAWAPVIALLVFAFTLGCALLLSSANLFFRDVKYIVQVLLTFGIFFTPVFFEPAMFGALGARLMMLNPLAPMLEGARLAVVEGHNLLRPLSIATDAAAVAVWQPWYLAYAAGWSILLLLSGALIFHRSEFIFAEYV
jgi:ABC-type polysaccharide/polyol phosphate export permease